LCFFSFPVGEWKSISILFRNFFCTYVDYGLRRADDTFPGSPFSSPSYIPGQWCWPFRTRDFPRDRLTTPNAPRQGLLSRLGTKATPFFFFFLFFYDVVGFSDVLFLFPPPSGVEAPSP